MTDVSFFESSFYDYWQHLVETLNSLNHYLIKVVVYTKVNFG